MKICFVGIDLINSSGGVEQTICSLASHYAEQGHVVHILCLDAQKGELFFTLHPAVIFHQPLRQRKQSQKIKSLLYRCKSLLPHAIFSHLREQLRWKRQLPLYHRGAIAACRSFIMQQDVDLYILHKCYLPFLHSWLDLQQQNRDTEKSGGSLARKMQGKIISFLHEPLIELQDFTKQGLNRYYNLFQLLSVNDLIGVNLKEHISQFPPALQDKVRVLALGIDYNYHGQGEQQEDPLETKAERPSQAAHLRQKQILFIGRLHPRKGVDLLIRAFIRAQTCAPHTMQGWKLILAGQAQDPVYTRLLHRECNPAIEFCGQVSEARRTELYQSSAFFVLPSLYEGLGLVLAEAMAHGLPCIGFADIPGVNTQIRQRKNGLLVAHYNRIAGLEKAILDLASSPEKRELWGQQAREDARYYAQTTFFQRWDELLQDLYPGTLV